MNNQLNPEVSAAVAEQFCNLDNEQRILIEDDNVSLRSAKGIGFSGTSQESRLIVEHILAHFQHGLEKGEPDVYLLDKLRAHPWTKQVFNANPELKEQYEALDYLYQKRLGQAVHADFQRAFIAIEDDIYENPVSGKSATANSAVYNSVSNHIIASVISEPDIDIRAQKLCRYMLLCIDQVNRGSFAGAMAVKTALQEIQLYNMDTTFESIPTKTREDYQEIGKFLNENKKTGFHSCCEVKKEQGADYIPYLTSLQGRISRMEEVYQIKYKELIKQNKTPKEAFEALGNNNPVAGSLFPDGKSITHCIESERTRLSSTAIPTTNTFERFIQKDKASYNKIYAEVDKKLQPEEKHKELVKKHLPNNAMPSTIFSEWKINNKMSTIVAQVKHFMASVKEKIASLGLASRSESDMDFNSLPGLQERQTVGPFCPLPSSYHNTMTTTITTKTNTSEEQQLPNKERNNNFSR